MLPPSDAIPDSKSILPHRSFRSFLSATTTLDHILAAENNAKLTDPLQQVLLLSLFFSSCLTFLRTPICICALDNCYRLYPNHDRLMAHRKRDHGSDSVVDIITWNV
ncbi:hypothetical protein Ac2012v2_001010 [Leucoagaricus gongylophorus]